MRNITCHSAVYQAGAFWGLVRTSMKPELKADKETAKQSTVAADHKEFLMLQACFSFLSLAVQSYTVAYWKRRWLSSLVQKPSLRRFWAAVWMVLVLALGDTTAWMSLADELSLSAGLVWHSIFVFSAVSRSMQGCLPFPCPVGGSLLTQEGNCAAPHASENGKRIKTRTGDTVINSLYFPTLLGLALMCLALGV